MSIKFAVRGDSFDARYASYSKLAGKFARGSAEPELIDTSGTTGAIGSSLISVAQASTSVAVERAVAWNGQYNWVTSTSWSVLLRLAPQHTGFPNTNRGLFYFKTNRSFNGYVEMAWRTDGKFEVGMSNETTSSLPYVTSTYIWSATSDTLYDLVLTFTGTSAEIWLDGTKQDTLLMASPLYSAGRDPLKISSLMFGSSDTRIPCGNYKIEEIVIWDEYINPAAVALENTTSGSLSGASRTSFVSVASFDGLNSTNPGISNVLSSTSYIISGVTYTGSYHNANYTDPGIANVASGTSYIFNDATLTGTLTNNYSDPGIANVRLNTNYIFNNSTLTGTLNVPEASSAASDVLDLNAIRENIRFVLEQNNTTTGAEVGDLSANLTQRVRLVSKINPELIPIDGGHLPAVTVYVNNKSIELKSVLRNMSQGKRQAEIDVTVAGLVWNQNMLDYKEDPSQRDIENLMENVEKILRGYDTLGGEVNWHFPSGVSYHTQRLDEQTHFRVAFMDLKLKVLY